MLTESQNSETNYKQIPDEIEAEDISENIDNTTGTAYAYAYYVIPTEPRSKKKCGGGCCLFLVVAFILCFFLYPRKPSIYLNELIFDSIGNGTGKFNFRNNNFFNMNWKNPDITLYWVPYNGQSVGQICYGDDDHCTSGKCLIKLGEFKNNNKFKTKSLSTNSRACFTSF